ncbi:hypothetical protein [Allomuricauda sp. d1]
MAENKDYNGFWKQAGCTLAAIAVIGFVGLIVMVFYFLFKGM